MNKPSIQQSIKIIAVTVVNMNIVFRINFSSKLKNSTSEIGYYSYTNRCLQCDTRANQAHLVFAAQKNAFAIKPKELDSRPTHLKTTK